MRSIVAANFRSLSFVWFLLILVAALVSVSPAWSDGTVSPGETRTFSEADGGSGSIISSNAFKGTDRDFIPEENTAQAAAFLSILAFNDSVSSFASVDTAFWVTRGSSGTETVLDATVSADVEWSGVLFGASVLGGGASVTIEMSLVDENTGVTTGKVQVVSENQNSVGIKGLDVGGTLISGTKRVSFPAKVVRTHLHTIRLKVTCEAEAGLVGVDIGCIFMDDAFNSGINDAFAKWNTLSINVEQDLFEQLATIQASIDALTIKVDNLQGDVDVITARQLEDIRLQVTPTGRRTTDVPACDGGACNFPNKP